MGQPRTLIDFPLGPTGGPNAPLASPVVKSWKHPIQSTSPWMLPWPHAPPVLPSRHAADTCGAGTRTPTFSTNHQSTLRVNPRVCRSRAASRDPGAMGIPYAGLGLITLVGTTHETSLLSAATRGRRAKTYVSN